MGDTWLESSWVEKVLVDTELTMNHMSCCHKGGSWGRQVVLLLFSGEATPGGLGPVLDFPVQEGQGHTGETPGTGLGFHDHGSTFEKLLGTDGIHLTKWWPD